MAYERANAMMGKEMCKTSWREDQAKRDAKEDMHVTEDRNCEKA